MDTQHRRRRQFTLFAAITTVAFLLFASSAAFTLNQLSVGGRTVGEERFIPRRRLGGPGSSPPACRSKCGRCTPCKPVHVPIHPGFSMKLEYYPEAWRCKCKDKLFMP